MPCGLKIFQNVFAFMYVKVHMNFREICEEISFPSFFRKMLMSAFLLRFKANYLQNKPINLPLFVFVDSNSPCKDLLFPRDPYLVQKPLYLVGTVLKSIRADTGSQCKLLSTGQSNMFISAAGCKQAGS